MPSLTCGSVLLPSFHPHQPASGEMFGAHLAELRLIEAVLEQDSELRWDLWKMDPPPSLTHTSRQPPAPPQLGQLQRFGDRVHIRSVEAVAAIAHQPSYLFLSSLPNMPKFAQLLTQMGARRTPICALSHSLYTRDMLLTYVGLVLAAEEHDRIVAPSGAAMQALEHLLDAGARYLAGRVAQSTARLAMPAVTRLPFGVDLPPENSLSREAARLLLRIPPQAVVVLYFGRISEEYKADLDPLLQTIHRARSLGHPVWLLLAGQSLDPVYSQHLQRRLHSLGLEPTSIVLENCPDFLKPALYGACDVVVSPVDSVQESFGLSILEAMAHSRPVLASDWSGYRDLVLEGETGFLIPTTWVPEAGEQASLHALLGPPLLAAHSLAQRTLLDAEALLARMIELVTNPGLRRAQGEAGRARVEALYTWPRVAVQFLELWQQQLAQSFSPPSPPPPLPFMELFSHYATARLHPDDLIVCPSAANSSEDQLHGWAFYSAQDGEPVRRLLALTASAPLSVGEAQHAGFALDTILWVVKKGLRTLVSAASAEAEHHG